MTADPTTAESATAESEVLAVLGELVRAHAAADPAAIVALHTPDAALYTLAPPLQQTQVPADEAAARLRAWLDTFTGGVGLEFREPVVTVGGDVAFAHCLTRMSATPVGAADPFSFWYRSTFGFRRVAGDWLITHEHESTPFYMDGSFRVAADLEP